MSNIIWHKNINIKYLSKNWDVTMEKKIVQISDVHFGALTFSEELKSNLMSQIQHENPDFIIFAGDATDHGYATEYSDAAAFIDELKNTTSYLFNEPYSKHSSAIEILPKSI